MNNNDNNDLVRYAMKKIRRDEQSKPTCYIVGPTGPTGATAPLFKSSNRLIAYLSSFPFLYQQKNTL